MFSGHDRHAVAMSQNDQASTPNTADQSDYVSASAMDSKSLHLPILYEHTEGKKIAPHFVPLTQALALLEC